MPSTTLLDAMPQLLSTPTKVTASFTSRPAAKRALTALRRAGYRNHEVSILHGSSRMEIDPGTLPHFVAKYLKHLASPQRILIRVVSPEVEVALLILRKTAAEVAVNHFFAAPAATVAVGAPRPGAALPQWKWRE